jgi:hypothetical protein
MVEVTNQLVDAALERGRFAALVESVANRFPELFQEKEREG